MRTVLQSLIWKELRELAGSALAVAAAALALPLAALWRGWEQLEFAAWMAFFVYPVLAGVFFGMRAAAGERASRTAPLVAALPVRTWLLGLTRLGASLAASLLPLLPLALLGAAAAARQAWLGAWISGVITWHLLLVVAVFGTGQPTEVRAAARGLGVLLLCLLVLALAAMLRDSDAAWRSIIHPLLPWLAALAPPFDWLADRSPWSDVPERPAMSAQRLVGLSAVLPALAIAFVVRYRRALEPNPQRRPWAWRRLWPGFPPPQSPLTALVWKHAREMVPVGLPVFGVAVLLSLLAAATAATSPRNDPFEVAGATLIQFAAIAGIVLSVLLGVGTFLDDLRPGINTFWRSRPISPHAWFWTKFVVGLGVLLAGAAGLPGLALRVVTGPSEASFAALCLPVALGLYALAALTTALVRHALYAGALAAGVAAIVHAAAEVTAGSGFEGGPLTAPPTAFAAAFLATFCAATVFAWQAAARDWSVPQGRG